MAKMKNKTKYKKPTQDEIIYSIEDFDDITLQSIVSRIITIKDSWNNALLSKHNQIEQCILASKNVIGGYDSADKTVNEYDEDCLPIAETVCRSAKARLINSLFSDDNWLQTESRIETAEGVSRSDKAEEHNRAVLKEIGFEQTFGKVLQSTLSTGWGITKVGWKQEKGLARSEYTEPVLDENGDIIKYETISEVKQTDIYNNVWIDLIDPLRFWFDPNYTDLKFSNVIEESKADYYDILNLNINGKYVYYIPNEYADELESRTINYEDTNSQAIRTDQNAGANTSNQETDLNVKLWNFYGSINILDSNNKRIKLRNYVITVLDERHIIRLEPYQNIDGRKHPYVLFECYPDPRGCVYTQGMLESCLPMQKHINDYIRQIFAIVDAKLKLRICYVEGSLSQEVIEGLTSAKTRNFFAPVAVGLKGKLQEFIMQFPFDNDISLPIQIVQIMENQIEKTTGVSSVAMGQADAQKRTATENMIRDTALDLRLTDILMSLERPMVELLTIISSYIKLNSGDMIEYNSRNGVERITRNELNAVKLDFTIKSIKTTIDQQRNIEKLTRAMNLILQSQQYPVLTPVIKKILREMDLPDIADSLADTPVIPANEAMNMLQSTAEAFVMNPQVVNALNSPEAMNPQVRNMIKDSVLNNVLSQGMQQGQGNQK